jgi:hypothetical protein
MREPGRKGMGRAGQYRPSPVTGGVAAQILAASHPELLRSLVLTNCDTEGNFPPPAFMPVIQATGAARSPRC